jgi:hypothetical protein
MTQLIHQSSSSTCPPLYQERNQHEPTLQTFVLEHDQLNSPLPTPRLFIVTGMCHDYMEGMERNVAAIDCFLMKKILYFTYLGSGSHL